MASATRRGAIAAGLLTGTLLLGACSPELDWRTVSPAAGGFSVLLPGRPEPEIRTVALAGQSLDLHLLSVHVKDSAWGVAWADLPEAVDAAARSELRKAALEGWGKLAGSPVEPVQVDAPGGLQCEAITARGTSGSRDLALAARACTTEHRYYQLITVGPGDQAEAGTRKGDDAIFLESLSLR